MTTPAHPLRYRPHAIVRLLGAKENHIVASGQFTERLKALLAAVEVTTKDLCPAAPVAAGRTGVGHDRQSDPT